MKQEFEKYLEDIKLSDVMIATMKAKYALAENLFGINEFTDIHVSETVSNSGSREYFSLFLFSEDLMFRVTLKTNEVVGYRFKSYVTRLSINTNYDVNSTPNDLSKYSLGFRRIDAEQAIELSSSGNNCKNLIAINKKYFISNLR